MRKDELFYFVENYGSAFFVGSLVEGKLLYMNKKAIELFECTTDTCDFDVMFGTSNGVIAKEIEVRLKNESQALIYNKSITTAKGETILVDVQLGYFDEEKTKVFLDLIIQQDSRMEMAIHHIETSYRAEAILEFDDALTIYHGNKLFYDVFGTDVNTHKEYFDHKISEGFRLDKKQQLMQEIHTGLTSKMTHYTELEIVSLTGEKKWYALDMERRLLGNHGEKLMCCMVNIDKRIKTEYELDTVNQYFKTLQNLSTDLLFRIDIKTKSLVRTDERSKTFGLKQVQPNFPKSVCDSGVVHHDDISTYMDFGLDALDGIESSVDVRMKTSDGEFQYQRICCSPVYGADGKVKEMFGKLVNLQESMDLEAKAKQDLLTGIYNKITFQEQVEHILLQDDEEVKHAFLFLDLDDFKGINDNLGHSFGDFLLTTVGKRLKRLVRDNDLLGRIGGDEFVIFLPTFGDKDLILERGFTILSTLRQDYHYQGNHATINASMGISIYPDHGITYEELYNSADKALYHSKHLGKNRASLYTEELEQGDASQ